MNRFSTADKLNKSRPVSSFSNIFVPSGNDNNSFFTTTTSSKPFSSLQQQSYRDQLLSVILQNAANS
jgi:hypothetical protein